MKLFLCALSTLLALPSTVTAQTPPAACTATCEWTGTFIRVTHDTDAINNGGVSSYHRCTHDANNGCLCTCADTVNPPPPPPPQPVVELLLQFKPMASFLQTDWAAVTDQTLDSDLIGLNLPHVRLNDNSELTSFILRARGLSGTLPSFAAHTALRLLYLDRNSLTGQAPDFSQNTALVDVYLHMNALTGTIPSLGDNTALKNFFMHKNQLTGTIPSFDSTPNIKELNLSFNQLTGTIPSFATNTELLFLRVNDNQLTDSASFIADTSNYPLSTNVFV